MRCSKESIKKFIKFLSIWGFCCTRETTCQRWYFFSLFYGVQKHCSRVH